MLRSILLHVAAGIVFSVVAVELLPDIVRIHAPWEVALGFGGGVVAMLLIRRLVEHKAKGRDRPEGTLPLAMLIGFAVDLAIDGLLLGIGFAAGAKEGLLLTLALAAEVLSLGLAVSAQLRQDGVSYARTLGTVVTLAGVFFVAALVGVSLLHGLSGRGLEIVLSFGLAALLFLVTEELLVEAHEEKETPWMTASFFGGFLLFLILGMLG
jgi:ZIP family zinc transporter